MYSWPAPSATTITAWRRVSDALAQRSPVVRPCSLPLQFEGDFGDEGEVDFVRGEHGGAGDEAGVAAHELDEADAVAGALGLGVGALDGVDGGGEGGLVAEAFVHVHDVVVDGLRDADDGDGAAALLRLAGDVERAAERAIAADDEEDIDAEVVEAVEDAADILRAARGAEECAAEAVHAGDGLRREGFDRVAVFLDEALVAVAESVDFVDAVAVIELHHEAADHIVQTGAETAAEGDDAADGLFGIEEYLPAGGHYTSQGGEGLAAGLHLRDTHSRVSLRSCPLVIVHKAVGAIWNIGETVERATRSLPGRDSGILRSSAVILSIVSPIGVPLRCARE